MKYFILLPELIVIGWIFLSTIVELKERYEIREIKIENKKETKIANISLYNIFINMLVTLYYINSEEIELMGNTLKIGTSELQMRLLITVLFGIGLFFYYKENTFEKGYEYFQLLLILYISTLLIVISKNLFLIYLLIELQSIIFYFLISWTSIKEGIDFFYQSIIFSVLMMFGLYLIYFVTETFELQIIIDIKNYLLNNNLEFENKIVNLGMFLIILSLVFKMGMFPFHLWLLKVLRKNNKIIVYYLGVFSKIVVLVLFYNLSELVLELKDLILLFGLVNVVAGSLGSLIQTRLTNIFFFSSMTHLGLLLIILSMSNQFSNVIYIYYVFLYLILSYIFVYYLVDFEKSIRVDELKYLYNENRQTTIGLVFLMFSFMGIPPLVGFYLKIGVIVSVLSTNNERWVVGVILLMSLLSLIMYLKVSKNLVFGSYESNFYKKEIRENKKIKNKERAFINFVGIFINTIMVFWYEELYIICILN